MMVRNKSALTLPTDELLRIYRMMLTIRAFEEQVRRMHLAGLAPGLVHLYSGQEAIAVGVCSALKPEDFIASHHRGHGHCIAKGARLDRLLAEILGRRPGYGMGRGGSMHIYDPETFNLGTNGIVGGSVALATGAALSAKVGGSGQVAVSFFGDGSLNQGHIFECMNMAAIWSLPVVFVCENNGYGEFTETDDVTAGRPYTKRGEAFDIPSQKIDGMDVVVVHEAAAKAVDRARRGQGPTFLVCDTYRFTGHHVGDKQEYKDQEERAAWEARDPIPKLSQLLVQTGRAAPDDLAAIAAEVRAEVAAIADEVKLMPEPEAEDLMAHIYADAS